MNYVKYQSGFTTSSIASDWTLLSTVEQASNTISDPGSFTTTGTNFDGQTFTWKMAGDTTQVDGWQENWAGWSQTITTLYPDFNSDTDEIELGVEVANMPLTTAKYGIFVGVCDTAITTRGSINAAGGTIIFPNSATNINAGVIGSTGLGSNVNITTSSVLVNVMRCRVRWLDQSLPEIRTTGDCSRSSGGDIAITSLGATGSAFGATVDNWRLIIGHCHVSAVSGTPTLSCRVYHRRLRTARVSLPDESVGTLPALGGAINIGVIGHSIAAGYAATGASITIPAGVTCIDEGVTLSAWPSSNPSPNRGIMHTFGQALLTAGYSQVNFFRRGTPGIALSTMMSTNWQNIINDMTTAGKVPDCLIIEIGENDAQAGEGATFAARLSKDIGDIQRMYPRLRVLIAEPVTTDLTGYPEIATINTAIYAVIAEDPATRGLIPNDGVTLFDTVHPNAAGHDVAGTAGAAVYLTLG